MYVYIGDCSSRVDTHETIPHKTVKIIVDKYMELLSDEALAAVVPIVVYWVYSGMYMAFGKSMDKYRLNPKVHEDSKNMVSKQNVISVVLTQQLMQLGTVVLVTKFTGGTAAANAPNSTSYLTVARQFLVAVIFYDGFQYAWHRTMHSNRFLYRNVHAWHHRLVVPYAFGALYGHPIEGLIADNFGGALAFLISGMSPYVSMFFFSLCTVKVIDNHCGMYLPFNPSFWNNAAFHEVHHQLRGYKYNYSNLFFTTWDKIFGTYMPYVVKIRPEGIILQVQPMDKTTKETS